MNLPDYSRTRFLNTFVILFAVLMLGLFCGTTSMMISVKRPAEINLQGFKQIAVGDITAADRRNRNHANDIADEITAKLFASGQFDVLDRQNLKRIIEEQKLSISGLVDEKSAAELGKVLGATAFIFGRVTNDNYKEDVTKGDVTVSKKDSSKHQLISRGGKYNLTVNLRVIDIETAKILVVRNFSAEFTDRKTADNKQPAQIDKNMLFLRCVSSVTDQFMKVVAPYDVNVRATFQKDKNLPELESAISFFKIGEWEDGLGLLTKASEKPGLETKVKAKAYYNLGLAQMYSSKYDESMENLKKAIALVPDSKTYNNAFLTAKSEKEKAEKLKQQIKKAG